MPVTFEAEPSKSAPFGAMVSDPLPTQLASMLQSDAGGVAGKVSVSVEGELVPK
jgi:hypothetical protein